MIFFPYLANQFPPPVHTDVEACFSSFNSNSTPKCVRLHYELGCKEKKRIFL